MIKDDDEDLNDQLTNKWRREADKIINKQNYKVHRNRKALVDAIRLLETAITSAENDNFNQSDDISLIDLPTKTAFFYKPFDLHNPNFKIYSHIGYELLCGNRRCSIPLVKVDNEIIDFEDKTQRMIVKSGQFQLEIQGEPHSHIFYVNKPRSHPLFHIQLQPPYQRHHGHEKITQCMAPPCEINIVATNEPHKIESPLICLKHNQNFYNFGYAVRPKESFNYEDSNSLVMNNSSFFNNSQSKSE